MELIEQEDVPEKDYLSLPTSALLEEFGKGNHIPGSGSASTLSALLGIEMMRTVIKLTVGKIEYTRQHDQFRYILADIETNIKPKLVELFNLDISEFHKVSFHRRQRDIAKEMGDLKKSEKHRELANIQLRSCTEIPLEVSKISLKLLEYAFSIFDQGFRAARGDSGVAISNILASISGSLFVSFLNLKSFRKSIWKEEKMKEAVDLALEFTRLQKQSYGRVIDLYNEGLDGDSPQLTLDF